MRIAKNDPRAHADQFVDEKHARLEHLFVHQDETLTLRCGDDGDRHEVGWERRPWLVFELWDVASQVTLDLAALVCGHDEIVSVHHALHPQPRKPHAHRSKVLYAGIGDTKLGPRDRRQPD